MLPTVWTGLAQSLSLTRLWISFSSSRVPRPSVRIRPLSNLTHFTIRKIDPLCYPNDIQELLAGSTKLRHLKMYFSPRMRQVREPSVNLYNYFVGGDLTIGGKMNLILLAMQNVYAISDDAVFRAVDMARVEEYTMIDSAIGANDDPELAFMATAWRSAMLQSSNPMGRVRILRGNKVSIRHATMLRNFSSLQRYYLVNGRPPHEDSANLFACNPIAWSAPPSTPAGGDSGGEVATLASRYLETISSAHGPALHHLVLMLHWRFDTTALSTLTQACPNLRQLGLSIVGPALPALRLLVPALHHLRAIHILDAPEETTITDAMRESGKAWHEEWLECEAAEGRWRVLRWMGLGEFVFELASVAVEGSKDPSGGGVG